MKIALMSDLHLEFERGPVAGADWPAFVRQRADTLHHPRIGPMIDNAVGVDLMVLAGDIDVGTRGVAYADEVAQYLGATVIYVLGNHEGYDGTPFDRLYDELHAKAAQTGGRVIFLENQATVIESDAERVHVLGATLWTDYEANGPQYVVDAMRDANSQLNDHERCRIRGSVFGPSAARGLHFASRAWIGAEIAKIRDAESDAKIVVATHHAPILEANPPQYRGGALAPAFVSDLRGEIAAWRPDLWVCGHTHHNIDETVGGTRVLSRQRGYIGREAGSLEFRPTIVDI
jgi:predicted MPP superfamily phosphohydrolase